ncbi:MAG: hypothetical protein KAH20_15200 [Methylococcales bacterium]|nr:hypothetical protein [Methylococcales bacterium]
MTGSNSSQPDLDWSQVKETVRLLTVSVAQVEKGMKEGDSSINTLADSFSSLVGHVNEISGLLNSLNPCEERESALAHCVETHQKIQTSIVAFQFYDRLQQSLSHVSDSLKGLSLLVESPERLYNPHEWKKFQNEIRNRYTMESEKIMFDAILQGKSIDEAVQLANKADDTEDDEIELF